MIPALASIEIFNLGIISFAAMAFSKRITLIKTSPPPRALGKTTLVFALAAVGGCGLPSHLLEPSSQNPSRIVVKWPNSQMVIEPVFPRTDSEPIFGLPAGEKTVVQLANAIQQTGRDQCLVLDRDAFGCLDRRWLAKAFSLIEGSVCQIIAFLPSIEPPIVPSTLQKSLSYELIEDPADPHRSTLVPLQIV